MESLIITEQNIINALCIYLSHKKNVEVNEIEVELYYDDEEADLFIAEAFVNDQQVLVPVIEMIAALRLWIDLYEEVDSTAAGINLDFNDTAGIHAVIR